MSRHALWVAAVAAIGFACKDKTPAAPRDAGADQREIVQKSHRVMGTMVTITAYTEDAAAAEKAFGDAFTEFERLEALLSVWRPKSDASRINNAAGKEPVKVTAETFAVIERAQSMSALTEGKFDITFGALAGLWKFDHDQDDSIPKQADIDARLPLVDYTKVKLDPTARTVQLTDPGVRIHLGGVGKGYAVDRAVEILNDAGLEDFMIQAGGDMYCGGKKGDRPWRVGIRDPRAERSEFFAFAEITDQTFSTSGDYERFFIKDGVRYHHILDPDLGRPARGTRSVTVMADDAITADILSTAIFILGAEKGLPIVESLDGVAAAIVDDENKLHVSSRLREKLTVLKQPTP